MTENYLFLVYQVLEPQLGTFGLAVVLLKHGLVALLQDSQFHPGSLDLLDLKTRDLDADLDLIFKFLVSQAKFNLEVIKVRETLGQGSEVLEVSFLLILALPRESLVLHLATHHQPGGMLRLNGGRPPREVSLPRLLKFESFYIREAQHLRRLHGFCSGQSA